MSPTRCLLVKSLRLFLRLSLPTEFSGSKLTETSRDLSTPDFF
ncbi:hypothetical protein ACJW30_04G023900 [Castanea mollissima]